MEQKKINEKDDGMVMDMNIEKDIFAWTQMERPFKRRTREFWLTAIAILVLVSVIFIFIKEFMLVVALLSILFLYYTMSTVEPSTIRYRITNRGIYWGDSRIEWGLLKRFWIKPNLDSEAVFFETYLKKLKNPKYILNNIDKLKNFPVKP